VLHSTKPLPGKAERRSTRESFLGKRRNPVSDAPGPGKNKTQSGMLPHFGEATPASQTEKDALLSPGEKRQALPKYKRPQYRLAVRKNAGARFFV
jgi:hypothetical protein